MILTCTDAGWQHLFESWLSSLPDSVSVEQKAEITALFEWLLPPLLHVARNTITSVLDVSEMSYAFAAMNLLESLLTEWRDTPRVGFVNNMQSFSRSRPCPLGGQCLCGAGD